MTLKEVQELSGPYCEKHYPKITDASTAALARALIHQVGHACSLLSCIGDSNTTIDKKFAQDSARQISEIFISAVVLCNKMDVSLSDKIEEILQKE